MEEKIWILFDVFMCVFICPLSLAHHLIPPFLFQDPLAGQFVNDNWTFVKSSTLEPFLVTTKLYITHWWQNSELLADKKL